MAAPTVVNRFRLLAGVWLALVWLLSWPATVEAAPAASDEVVPPQLVQGADLEYPPELLEQAEPPAGTVIVKLTIGTDGVPFDLAVEQSVHPAIDRAALDAVSRLRFQPASRGGQPIEIVTRLPIEVVPPERPEPAAEPEPQAPPETAEPASPQDSTPTAEGPSTPPAPAGPVRLAGSVLEAGQRTPIEGATVVVVPADADAELGRVRKTIYEVATVPPWQRQASSENDGRFAVSDVPDGKVRVVVLAPGYERLEYIERLNPNQALTVRYYLVRLPDNPYRTVVTTRLDEREEVSRRTISVEEINNLPGTQGDALKSIQNFPGVARPPFGIGLIVIRGADPSDSVVYLGEHEIPQLFHFGGLTSVFNSDVIENIDYIPGNFDARFGDAIGGVIDVKIRKGRRDGYHGYIDSDVFDTALFVEGPIGKGSFVLSGRRSYIDLLLPAVIPDDAGLDLAVAPRYYDYQALFDYPVSKGNISVKVFGSDDRARLISSSPNEIDTDQRDRFESSFVFHRVDLLYENHRNDWDILITPSYRYDFVSVGASDIFRFDLTANSGSFRAEVGKAVTKRIRWDVGAQLSGGEFVIDAQAPPVPSTGTGSSDAQLALRSTTSFFAPAVYGTVTAGLGERFKLIPGVRLNAWGVLEGRLSLDPRLRFVWDVADRTSIRGGIGLFSQVSDPPEWNELFGNPRIRPERAIHSSLSVQQTFDYGITLEVTGFAKHLYDLATPSPTFVERPDGRIGPENTASQGIGRIYGGEIFFRKELTKNVFGWVSYTVSRSERKPRPDEPWRLFDLDQTHILTVLGVYRLPKNWQIGARFRLVSGNPYTPALGSVYDASDGGYVPVWGAVNSERVPMFHQLDLRVDKRWIWRRLMLNLYLDVLNVYNRQNPEFINYSYDFRQTDFIPSLPIIPSLGFKLEW